MTELTNELFDEDYFNDVVEIAMYTIEVIAKTTYEDENGNIDWDRTYDDVYKTYSGPIDVQMFNEAIVLIEESATKYTDNMTVPPGVTIH
jgi:hypothetical protein